MQSCIHDTKFPYNLPLNCRQFFHVWKSARDVSRIRGALIKNCRDKPPTISCTWASFACSCPCRGRCSFCSPPPFAPLSRASDRRRPETLHRVKIYFTQNKTWSLYLVNVFPCFGWSFDVSDAPLFGTVACLLECHLPPLLQVALVSDQQEWNVLVVLYTQNLLPETNSTGYDKRLSGPANSCLKSWVAWKLSSSVIENIQRKPSPLRK